MIKVNPYAIAEYWMESSMDTKDEVVNFIHDSYMFMAKFKHEEHLRAQHPILKELWENYQMALKLMAERH